MTRPLEGKIALVTGGASGIGRATCLRLADAGADLVIGDISERGVGVVDEVRATGRRAVFVRADTADEAANEKLADSAIREFGRLDVAVAAAGIPYAGYSLANERTDASPVDNPGGTFLVDKPVTAWDRVIAVNLRGVMLTNVSAARRMIQSGIVGSIVNVSSAAGWKPMPGIAEYCVSKAGVQMLTRVLAAELGPRGIRVNCVAPGMIRTAMTASFLARDDLREPMMATTPLRRPGEPTDVAEVILFLASEASSYVTGKVVEVDGGWS